MGRPAARSAHACGYNCYWAKFPLSAISNLLGHTCEDHPLVSKLVARFSFIGPAPRYLYAKLRGDLKAKKYHNETLRILGRVQRALEKRFGISLSRYAVQVNPCDFCHFCCALEHKHSQSCGPDCALTFNEYLRVDKLVRSGIPSPGRLQLLLTNAMERDAIATRVALLSLGDASNIALEYYRSWWHTYTVQQQAYLLRHCDAASLLKQALRKEEDSSQGPPNKKNRSTVILDPRQIVNQRSRAVLHRIGANHMTWAVCQCALRPVLVKDTA